MLSRQEQRYAALASNAAIFKLATAFERRGLNHMAALDLAAKHINNATLELESTMERLLNRDAA